MMDLIEYPLSYSYLAESGQILSNGEARIQLDNEVLSLLPKFGSALSYSLLEILDISAKDFRISLALSSNESLILDHLGYAYEDFLRNLFKLRNEKLLKESLVQETTQKANAEAEFMFTDETGNKLGEGPCEIILYETALIILPQKSKFLRILYSDISQVRDEDYTLQLNTELGGKVSLLKMGRRFDFIKKTLSEVMNALFLRTQSMLETLLPHLDSSVLRRLAPFMRDGKAVNKINVQSISSVLWEALEKSLSHPKERYEFLKSLSQMEKIGIGLKRGLLGDLTGEYIWFLVPIYSDHPKEIGNAVAMEAFSEEEDGKATYFFRLVSRKDYPNFKGIEELHQKWDHLMKKINRSMLDINFRREPIYLSDEKLKDPQYIRYRFAVQNLPSLQTLRDLFIGRVIHSTFEQWKTDVMDLLRFNIESSEDSEKWER